MLRSIERRWNALPHRMRRRATGSLETLGCDVELAQLVKHRWPGMQSFNAAAA
jgi:hypothetical protein